MRTLTAMFDDDMQAKLKQIAGLMRATVAAPTRAARQVVKQTTKTVMSSARTKPVVYNEWD